MEPSIPSIELDEHPQSAAICAQVEFYFSDANLARDHRLFILCGGSENKPVLLDEIFSRKEMLEFRPKSQVIASLKKSTSLEIIDIERIKRRIPLHPNKVNHKSQDDPSNRLDDPFELAQIPFVPAESTEHVRPGFQVCNNVVGPVNARVKHGDEVAGLVEGPLTPQQHVEEYDLYGPGISLRERLQTAIYRFYTRPKFDQGHKQLLNQFLQFGGISVVPVMFGGTSKLDKQEIKQLDPLLQARLLGIHELPAELTDSQKFIVDFVAVAKAYLGGLVQFEPSSRKAAKCCKLIVNFYNYLMLHNVCPEYQSQLLDVRKLADQQAPQELEILYAIPNCLPGKFNSALRLLSGISLNQHECCTAIKTVEQIFSNTNHLDFVQDISTCQNWYKDIRNIKVVSKMFRILAIKSTALVSASSTWSQKPLTLSRVHCQVWNNDFGLNTDVPKLYHVDDEPLSFDLFFEHDIAELFRQGMSFRAKLRLIHVCEKTLWIFDSLQAIYCSFYHPILNEILPRENLKSVKWKVGMPALGKAAGDFGPIESRAS